MTCSIGRARSSTATSGTLRRVSLALTGSGPVAITASDLRHAGRLDLIVAESVSSTVGVLLSNGDGTFQPEVEYALPGSPLSVVTGDFNGDGNLDVVIGNSGAIGVGPVTFLAGNGSGGLGAAVYPQVTNNNTGAQSLAVGDFNQDGKLDLIVTDDLNFVFLVSTAYVELGNGDGTFQRGKTIADSDASFASIYITSTPVADINHDGCLDTVVIDTTSTAQIYLGNCDGTFTASTHAPTGLGDSSFSADLVDVNGDGVLDLVSGGSQFYLATPDLSGANAGNLVSIALGDGNGGFAQQATVYRTGGANLFGLAVAALHSGGEPDIIAPSALGSTLSVLANDGTGHFQAATGSAEAYFGGGSLNVPTSQPVVVDLNGDGLPDLAVLHSQQYDPGSFTLWVMLQNSDGTFAEPISSNFFPGVTLTTVSFPFSFAFGDFRGIGLPDVIGTSNEVIDAPASEFNSLYYSQNDGGGSFETPSALTTPAANGVLAVGDFNGDGKLDFVIAGITTTAPALTVFLEMAMALLLNRRLFLFP